MNARTVVVVTKPQDDVIDVGAKLIEWFKRRGIEAGTERAVASKADLAVVVGGDGTLLAAARLLDDRQVPILAINHGALGFLTEVTLDEMYPALERVLGGHFITERRMMMDIALMRGRKRVADYRALNDAVINKGTVSRIIELEASVDGQYVSRFRSDGLIVATPTGSTAYNLSAGGPVMFPSMNAMILTPICSHTLTNRPIVLPEGVSIEIMLRSAQSEAHVTIDGQVGQALETADRLKIRKSAVAVKLVSPADKNYFDVLRRKLKWG
jgi:NAD+ kinase